LQQEYAHVEVIVVDDGSTDTSRDVIASYATRITSILKPNGGQASALNAGFTASRGEIVVFLDSDDLLLPFATTNVVARFREPGISNVHWPMWLIDSQGSRTGGTRPPNAPDEGDFREQLLERGPSNLPSSPTSGNAWARSFLQRILPIPEDVPYYRKCADEYLYTLAPAFGRLRTIGQPQGCYRLHGQNYYSGRSVLEQLKLELEGYDHQCSAVSAALLRNGVSVDVSRWKRYSWFHQLDRALSDILQHVPEDANLVLVEGGAWDAAGALASRNVRPFLARDGNDWGPPENCDTAIAELEKMSRDSIHYLAIGWPSFWWFTEYPRLFEHLERNASCVLQNEVVVIYRIAPSKHVFADAISSRARAE
jgi:hypothetical protein